MPFAAYSIIPNSIGWVDHTSEVIRDSQQLLLSFLDAETGQRGYLVTGSESYLESYYQSAGSVRSQTEALRRLTADNPAQQERLERLAPIAQERLAELAETIRLFRLQAHDAAKGIVSTDRGKVAMDSIRSLLSQFQEEEERLLTVRLRRRQHNLMLIGAGALATVIIWLLSLAASVRRIRKMHRALKRAHRRLATKHGVAGMGAFDWDVQQAELKWTREMENLYGIYSPDHTHTFEEWKACVHPEDLEEAVAVLEDAWRNRLRRDNHLFRIVRPDGEVRWTHSRRKYRYNDEGALVHVIGADVDITDLKQGEMAQNILGGLYRVCSSCRRIHEKETGQWYPMEAYLRRHSTARFSHGMCGDCCEQWCAEDREMEEARAAQ
jgi:PAS domain S-box-containing protein